MEILKEISEVVDSSEFATGKTGDGEKKRSRCRINQMSIEMNQLMRKIRHIKSEVVRLEQKLEDKVRIYTPEAKALLKQLA